MRWSVVVACNDDGIINRCLLRSPDIQTAEGVAIMRGYSSAACAYNAALKGSEGDVVVLVHQDVYLPRGWLEALSRAVEWLEREDPQWGVLGCFGVDTVGCGVGQIYSTGLGRIVGGAREQPTAVTSLDEMVIVMRRQTGLRFDEQLPGFHLYGTDICLEAAGHGLKSYAVLARCLHNSNGIRFLPKEFWHAYFYLRKKWWWQLPIRTPCVSITKGCGPVLKETVGRSCYQLWCRKPLGTRARDPVALWNKLHL